MHKARQRNKLKMGPVIVLIVLALVGAFFGIKKLTDSGAIDNLASKAEQTDRIKKGVKTIRVGVCTWGGYAGGEFYNGGFKFDKKASRFYKDFGLEVEFVKVEDLGEALSMLKKDELDLSWCTVDAFTARYKDIADVDPKIVFQSDWSRGGDAIVANPMVKNVADLKGKKVAVALRTPSQSLLIKTLEANNMTISDIVLVEAKDAIDAAEKFKSNEVDAAVVWSPDDQTCLSEVTGSKILTSTKDATNIIADVFIAKGAWVEKNDQALQKLIKGWMTGNAEINTSAEAKDSAVKVLESNLDISFGKSAIENARLVTIEDNKNFFKLNTDYKGIDGEEIYKSMSKVYTNLGYAPTDLPKWAEVSSREALRSVDLTGSIHKAEPAFTFATESKSKESKKDAFASKNVTINFPSGGYELTDASKFAVNNDVATIINTFGGVKIRVEGNTDNVGNPALNKILSEKRAQAVVDYLIATYGYDADRFVVVGHGSDKPVADNASEAGQAQNRRTEIKFIK
jgi:NitT/TauT family transport system substrate-binding protein